MANQSVTPADIFADLLRFRAPAAIAWVRGGDAAPNLSGLVKFYQTPYSGVLVEAEIFNLPNKQEPGSTDFYAMHIPVSYTHLRQLTTLQKFAEPEYRSP